MTKNILIIVATIICCLVVFVVFAYWVGSREDAKNEETETLPPDSRPNIILPKVSDGLMSKLPEDWATKTTIVSNPLLVKTALYEVFEKQLKNHLISDEEIENLLKILEV